MGQHSAACIQACVRMPTSILVGMRANWVRAHFLRSFCAEALHFWETSHPGRPVPEQTYKDEYMDFSVRACQQAFLLTSVSLVSDLILFTSGMVNHANSRASLVPPKFLPSMEVC